LSYLRFRLTLFRLEKTMETRRSVLIVEDDEVFARTLCRSFQRRDYDVFHCAGREEMSDVLREVSPRYAVVDLKLARGSGLECVKLLRTECRGIKIVVLTGFASIATAVEAIKLGACHYLAKPANTDDIVAAFERAEGDVNVPVANRGTSIKNLEWERIHETLADADFNISEAARRLGLHRRTLARKLKKRHVK